MRVLNCPNCTGTINLEKGMQTGLCPFCGTRVAMGDISAANDAGSGDALYDLGEYQRAAELYQQATKSSPEDYRTWRGMMRIALREYDNAAFKYADNAMKLAGTNEIESIGSDLQKFVDDNLANLRTEASIAQSSFIEQTSRINRYNPGRPDPNELTQINAAAKQQAKASKSVPETIVQLVKYALVAITILCAILDFSSLGATALTLFLLSIPTQIILRKLHERQVRKALLQNWDSVRREAFVQNDRAYNNAKTHWEQADFKVKYIESLVAHYQLDA